MKPDVTGALSLDALLGTDVAFDARIHEIRPHPGQRLVGGQPATLAPGQLVARVASRLRPGSGCVQPPLHAPGPRRRPRRARLRGARPSTVEMNAATDNPLVFAETGELLSGGNFHGEPMALAADFLAIAIAEIGAISERRIERLVNPSCPGCRPSSRREGGLRSGFMIAQVTAAALASENKTLAHPASVDSIPTSANKEDHVSMGVTAATQGTPRRVATCGASSPSRPSPRVRRWSSSAPSARRTRLKPRIPACERRCRSTTPIGPSARTSKPPPTSSSRERLAAAASTRCGALE